MNKPEPSEATGSTPVSLPELRQCAGDWENLPTEIVQKRLGELARGGASTVLLNRLSIHFQVPARMNAGDEILPDTLIGGEYKIIKTIGRGGMGIVYEAVLQKTGQTVALKMILPGFLLEELRARFLLEMRALGRLDHPGIVGIRHAGVHTYPDGVTTDFFVMERITGSSLQEYVRGENGILSEKIRLIRDAALAVEYAHDRGVIHRDLKPANMMVRPNGQLVILDFGLAAALMEGPGLIPGAEGTYPYMAPEQAGASDPSASADVYSLGVILFEILGGTFQHGLPATAPLSEKLALARTPPPRRPLAVTESCPALERILDKVLAADQDDRYPSAAALARALNWILPAHLVKDSPSWKPAKDGIIPGTDWMLEQMLGDGAHGQVWLARNRAPATSPEAAVPPPRVYKFCATEEAARSLRREVRVYRILNAAIRNQTPASEVTRPALGFVPIERWSLEASPFYIAMQWVPGAVDLETWLADRQNQILESTSAHPQLETGLSVEPDPAEILRESTTATPSPASDDAPASPPIASSGTWPACPSGTLPETTFIPLVCSIAGALQFAHENGILHRDIKPDNILVCRDPDSPGGMRAWLMDFGLADIDEKAWVMLRSLSMTGNQNRIVGGADYIAPETKKGASATTRSDIYSLGVVIYRLYCGDPKAPLLNWQSNPALEPLLKEVLTRCLADKPEERFPSSAALAESLCGLPERRAAAEEAERLKHLAEVHNLKLLETARRTAYRKGVVRTTVVSACLFAILGWLGWIAYDSSRKASNRQAQLRLAGISILRQSSSNERRQQILERFAEARNNIPIEHKTAMREELIAALTIPFGKTTKQHHFPPSAALVQGGGWAVWTDADRWHCQKIILGQRGTPEEEFNLPARLSKSAISSNGQMAAAVTEDGRLFARIGQTPFFEVAGGCGPESVAISSTGTIAAPGKDGGIRLFLLAGSSWIESKIMAAAPPVLSLGPLLADNTEPSNTPIASADCLEFSLDGRRLASGGRSGLMVRMWDVETGDLIGQAYHRNTISCLTWDPSVPGMLWSAAEDGEICGWTSPSSGQKGNSLVRAWHRLAATESSAPVALAISPDGLSVAVVNEEGGCRVISRHNPAAFESMQEHDIKSCTFDGNSTLLTLSNSGELHSIAPDLRFFHKASLGSHAVRGLAFLKGTYTGNDSTLIAGSSGPTVGLLDARDARRVLKLHTDLAGETGGIAFSPFESKLFSVQNGLMRIWSWNTTKDVLMVQPPIPNERYKEVNHLAAVSASGRRWLAFSREEEVGSGTVKRVVTRVTCVLPDPAIEWDVPGDNVSSIAAGPGCFAVSHFGGTPTQLCKPAVLPADQSIVLLPSPPEEVWSVACSGDGRWIAERMSGGVRVTDAASLKPVGYFRIPRAAHDSRSSLMPVVPMALSHDGHLLAITTAKQEIHLLQLPGGLLITRLTAPEEAGVASLLFTEQGDLVAGSADGRLFLWNLPAIRQELRSYDLDWEAPVQRISTGEPIILHALH